MHLPSLFVCAALSWSLPCSTAPAPPGEQEHHGYGLALAQHGNGLLQGHPWWSLGLRGGRAWIEGVQRWCSVSAGSPVKMGSALCFSISSFRHSEALPASPCTFIPTTPQCQPGVDLVHPQAAPPPQAALFLPIPVLTDTQPGISALGWSQQPPLHPLKNSG